LTFKIIILLHVFHKNYDHTSDPFGAKRCPHHQWTSTATTTIVGAPVATPPHDGYTQACSAVDTSAKLIRDTRSRGNSRRRRQEESSLPTSRRRSSAQQQRTQELILSQELGKKKFEFLKVSASVSARVITAAARLLLLPPLLLQPSCSQSR
jgi:hypothetical protein